jgi:hypothetical protein
LITFTEKDLRSHGDPTNFEQYQLELVNAARAKPAAEATRLGIDLNQGLMPGQISTEPKQPLAFHPLLLQTARKYSDWMLDTDTFSHTGAGGSTPTMRAAAEGYEFSVGENIAWVGDEASLDPKESTIKTHDNLFISADHRPNLMDPFYSVVGLGLRTGIFFDTKKNTNLNALMVTQNFSSGGNSTDSGPFLVGVVYNDANENGAYDPGEGLPGVRVEPTYGGYHAVTSQSGGYAVPLPPNETQSEDEALPFDVQHLQDSDWDQVRPYDDAFRTQKINDAAQLKIQINWSGGSLNQATQTETTIRKPTRINYKLKGTDNYYYKRTMVSSLNVKADFKLSPPKPPVVIPPSITSDLSAISVPKGKLISRFAITTNFGAKSFAAKGLPRGLKLNTKTGVISGKPTKTGTYAISLTTRKMKGKKVEQQATATKVFVVY